MTDYRPIPGYEGLYWIDSKGNIINRANHIMKQTETKNGFIIELRKNGQREKVLITKPCSSGLSSPIKITCLDELSKFPVEEKIQ